MRMCGLLILSITVSAFASAQPVQENNIPTRMDQIVRFQVDNREFTGSVLVAKGDQIVFDKGYGMANIEGSISNTPATKFRIGSLTKQFTAAAILLLEEQGKLKVEDPIDKYWPDAPAAWDKVTLFHLLTHTSGITDGEPSEYESLQASVQSVEQAVGYFRTKELSFAPGSKYEYSNAGYILLAI